MTNTALAMRDATEADLPAVLALAAQPGFDDGVVLGLPEATAVFRKMQSYPSYRMYVAEAGGAVVGTYTLLIMDNIAHMATPSAVVEQVIVAPEAQGLGVGTAMMTHAAETAGAAGCYKLTLSSSLKRTKAHAFYDKLGFVRHGYSFLLPLASEVKP